MRSRQSIFQSIIETSVSRVRSSFIPSELEPFQQNMKSIPQKLKQLNIEPYMFIFQTLLKKRQNVEYVLKTYQTLLEQNFLSKNLIDCVALQMKTLIADYSYLIIQILSKVTEPNLYIFDIFFEIHSTIAMPEDALKKFRSVAYTWLIRAFSFMEKPLDPFFQLFYQKVVPQQMPKLRKSEDQRIKTENYIRLIINDNISKIQEKLQEPKAKGKRGWICFMCQKPADYFCKDTGIEVCGSECKNNHLALLTLTNSLNFQFSDQFRQQIQLMLLKNLNTKKSPSITLDFLNAILLHSSYTPKHKLPHRNILILPVIVQRVWLLYSLWYQRRGEMFQHIFADGLAGKNDFLLQMTEQYFIKIAGTPRMFELYWNYDCIGYTKLFTYILNKIQSTNKLPFVTNVIDLIFNNFKNTKIIYQNRNKSILRIFNYGNQLPIDQFEFIGDQGPEIAMIRFIIKNETQINKDKLAEVFVKDAKEGKQFNSDKICKLFLQMLIQPIKDAQIDEIIREIFYFINVKVSQKIYHLFELFCEVYQPRPPFNENTLFQYSYFILMIITQIHNPGIVQRPTYQKILNRAGIISLQLKEKHPQMIKGMFNRISVHPFSQQTRGVLQFYRPVPKSPINPEHFLPQMILIDNFELIYQILQGNKADIKIIYRCCCILINNPSICQTFLQQLIKRLSDEEKDEYLINAIKNIIQEQPNAVGSLWKQIFQEMHKHQQQVNRQKLKEQTSGSDLSVQDTSNQFDLNLLILSTRELTDPNFINFCKEFFLNYLMSVEIDQYIQLITLNIERIKILEPFLIASFKKTDNKYIKIKLIQFLITILEEIESSSGDMFLLFLEEIQIDPLTQNLLFQIFVILSLKELSISKRIWEIISQKTLQMKDQRKGMLIEQIMKNSKTCECYEPYLIQRNLNSNQTQLISQQILTNLIKLEPYLHQLSPNILKLFILPQNLLIIMKNFRYFGMFQEACVLVLQEYSKEECKITQQIQKAFLQELNQMFLVNWKQKDYEFLLNLQIPRLIMFITAHQNNKKLSGIKTLQNYISVIYFQTQESYNESDLRLNLIKIKHINAIVEHLYQYIHYLLDSELDVEQISLLLIDLHQISKNLSLLSNTFNQNIPLRISLLKFLKTFKNHITSLPSLITSEMKCFKIQIIIKNRLYAKDPSMENYPLTDFFEIFTVKLEKQRNFNKEQISVLRKNKNKDPFNQKWLQFIEFQKSLQKYKESFIELLYSDLKSQSLYLSSKNEKIQECNSKIKSFLMKILLQGLYNQEICEFVSLINSQIGEKILQIINCF